MAAANRQNKTTAIGLMFQDQPALDEERPASMLGTRTAAAGSQSGTGPGDIRYEYDAVSPWNGFLDYMTAEKMNTENMSIFLAQVSEAHRDEFIIMVLDALHPIKAKN